MTPAQRIVATLRGRWYGSSGGYGYVRCVVHEDRRPSLRIRDGNSGLLVQCAAGCNRWDIIAELRRRGLLEETLQSPRQASARIDEAERQRRIRDAREIWHATQDAAGSLAEQYLRSRGISTAVPPTIRFHPALKYRHTGALLPAMVAAVQGADRAICGVHRTFLAPDGSGKALVDDPKVSLGVISGGAVRLAAARSELAIGEGIETCLSFMEGTDIATWAALSTSGLRSIILPPMPFASTVYIAVDADGAGESAAEAAALRLMQEGRKIKIARPVHGKDFNDALRESVA